MKKTYETGLWGESFASDYLSRKLGMIPLEHRFRTRNGEIDLIMRDGETVVFIEVKTRNSGKPGDGLSAVSPSKQQRITRAAILYLMRKGWLQKPVRFDIVEIYEGEVLHISDAFQPFGSFRV